MTQREKIEEIANKLSDSSASRGWLDCKSGSEDTHPRNDLIDIAITQIETLITEGKIEEVKRLEFTVTATEKAIGGEGGNIKLETLRAYTKLRLGELQASLKGKQDE